MLIFRSRLLRLAGFGGVTLWILAAPACNVPVFRYALERWPADPYEVVVFHHPSLTTEQQALLERLDQTARDGLVNIALTRVNLAADFSEPLRKLWKAQQNPVSPWMVLRYPRQTGVEASAWAGPLNAETVGLALESPARRDIAQKLMSGDAVVWLLLESGDRRRDHELGQVLDAELRKLEQSLELPERSSRDPPINPDLPLKIVFSTVRVARANPAERMLVNILLNWSTNLVSSTEMMLFPIFGRGRVIPPAIGNEIRPAAIRDMAEFLTGPCSCEVKEVNPGYDLLLSANWDLLTGYQELLLPDPPPLVGMSQFAAVAATNSTVPSGTSPALTLATAASGTAPATARQNHLVRNVAVFLGIGILFLAAMTLVFKVKAGRKSR